jgi:hypothetical protein
MRVRACILLISVFCFACVMSNSEPDVETDLKSAMQKYLYSQVNNDSSNVQYRVQSVIFYNDAKNNFYICDFTVYMKVRSFDTTGTMRATISRDFKTVKRIS